MENSINKNYHKTSDLALAATLSLYSPIQSIESDDGHRMVFLFDKTPQINDLISKFLMGELRIEPQQYYNQLKVIKTRIYSRT
jgi:hypothetical protein